jgi:hypothetical protein
MRHFDKHRFSEYAFTNEVMPSIDLHKETKKSGSVEIDQNKMLVTLPEKDGATIPLDISVWLPFAAPKYQISRDLNDYILTPVIVMPSDLPNRNAVAFPLLELVKFHPNLGQQAYKSWKGKPTHYEHANDDITKAYGVIADSFMRKMVGFNHGRIWKILLLLAFDRSKNPDVVNRIISGDLNTYSMGAFIGSYTCSYCGEELGNGCTHLDLDKPGVMYELGSKLVFRNVRDVEGFECSGVESPAFLSALTDTIIHIKNPKNF